jgi:DNA polymerase III subunit delta'
MIVMNWEMLGHEWAVHLLKEHVAQNQVRHAYLFTGPQGVGRRTLALRLAQALNCPQPLASGEPCRRCRICSQIDRMQHADLAVVQAEQQGGTLKVDQVRELQRGLALSPYEARYRVALLLRFEEAHVSAMNALLKTLEEPAQQVVLVLTADNAEGLLPTIVSRCEVLRLRPVALETVKQGLIERFSISAEQAQLLSHISGGRPGYAIRLHQQPDLLEQRRAWLENHAHLLASSRVDRFAYVEALVKDREALPMVLMVWLSYWRDVLLCSSGSSTPLANQDRKDEIDQLAHRWSLQEVYRVVASLKHTLDLLEQNINARLAAEVLMLDLPYLTS